MRGYTTQKGNNIMGKLSKAKQMTDAEKYCIQGMRYNDMSPEEISKTLGRDLEEINIYIKFLHVI